MCRRPHATTQRFPPCLGCFQMGEHQSASFRSRRLPLPQTYSLDGTATVTASYLLNSEIPEVYQLICRAAEAGLNVGWDEYPTLYHLHQLINSSEVFVFRRSEREIRSPDLLAAVVVQPYWMCGEDPCVACLWFFLSPALAPGYFEGLVLLATDFTKQLDLGYYACVHHVFITCKDLVRALNTAGYRVTAYFPDCGKIVKEGHAVRTSSYLYFKDLGVPKRLVSGQYLA